MRRKQDGPPRPSGSEGSGTVPNRLEGLLLRQRAAQQQLQQDNMGQFPARMDDIVMRQQQLLRQEQFQQQQQFAPGPQQRGSNAGQMMLPSDFASLPQGQPSVPAMPSLQEITRAEEILAAARDALTASTPAQAASAASRNQLSNFQDDFGGLNRPMLGATAQEQNPRWGSYGQTLRTTGQPENMAINSGLGQQDMSMLLSKQNQGLSLATAAQNNPPQSQQNFPSQMAMRQQQQQGGVMNQMPHDNMGLLESLILRQEEERLLMSKRQHPSSSFDDDTAARPSKRAWAAAGLSGMDPQPLPPHHHMMADKTMMQPFALGGPMDTQVKRAPQRKRRAKTFPVKLMELMIEYYDESIAAWLPDGRSFVVVEPDLFVEKILTKTFKDCKYASFVRKLNRWGFTRLTSGTGTDCFHHPLFQRDRMDLCARMLCNPRNDSKKAADKRMQEERARAAAAAQQNTDPSEQPSLAGVEKFFSPSKQSAAAKMPSKQTDDEDEEHDSQHEEGSADEAPAESGDQGAGSGFAV